MPASPSQAIVFVTHVESERIGWHFQRLARESMPFLPAFLCVHESEARPPEAQLPADFRLSIADSARALPGRFAEMQERRRTLGTGFTDLTYMPALLSPALRGYEHIWIVEYDVDYAGDWGRFFSTVMDSQADLIGTTFVSRGHSAAWSQWEWFITPADVPPEQHLRSFIPLFRVSRRLIDRYVSDVRDGAWQGHTEALYPTIARHHGLTVADLGADRPLYTNTRDHWTLSPGTFVYRPFVSGAYFHEDPIDFPVRDLLYHPCGVRKVRPSLLHAGQARTTTTGG